MTTDTTLNSVRRVAVACDFSEGADAAVARGTQLAMAHGARLDLVHAFDVGSLRALRSVFDVDRLFAGQPATQAAKERLSAVAAELGAASGLEVEACFGVGEPAAVLAAHVKARNPAVVVAGRRADPQDPGIGSTLLTVLRDAACPILVVRAGHPHPCRSVVSAVDLRDVSRRAAMVAAALFPDAEHRLICALDAAWERQVWRASGMLPSVDTGVDALRKALTARLDAVAHDMAGRIGSPVVTELVEAVPARAIVGHAKSAAADCVAVGRHGQGMLADHLLGSTTLDVIHHTARDVLVVS